MVDFLEALWGNLDGDHAGYLWTGQDKRSRWFSWPTELAEASLQASELADSKHDVYFGVGLGPRKLTGGQRTEAHLVTAIAGIWADIDYRNENHKKKNLPPNIDAAVKLAVDMPLPPTMIQSTGHGIAAWWLFKEPWEFATPQEREEAAWMVQAWQRGLRARASEQGWDVDATHDLARVMRVSGTKNFKDPADVKDVVLLEEYSETRRYLREDIEMCLIDVEPQLRGKVAVTELAADWKPGPLLSTDRYIALMEEDEKFKASWNHKRPDLQDQSLSSYDLSLASLAANAGWSDEELATLLYEHRRAWGDTAKGERKDYLAKTIAVARRKGVIESSIDAIMRGDSTALTSGDNMDKARAAWRTVGIEDMVSWYKTSGDQVEFVLVTPGQELRFSEETFGTFRSAQRRVQTNLGTSLRNMTQNAWGTTVAGLTRLAEVRGEDDDPTARIRGWLQDYINDSRLEETSIEDRRDRVRNQGPILIAPTNDYGFKRQIAVHGAAFLRFIQVADAEDKLSKAELGRLWLRAGGKVNVKVAAQNADGGQTTIRVWTIPETQEA